VEGLRALGKWKDRALMSHAVGVYSAPVQLAGRARLPEHMARIPVPPKGRNGSKLRGSSH
jgi:hypothetical protein